MVVLKLTCLLTALTIFYGCAQNNSNSSDAASAKSATTPSGEQLFRINCAQCHKPSEDFTGPALKDVASRWKNKTLLYEFVKNSQEIIARDAYAKALFEKWNRAYMQPFPDLTDQEIDRILAYCQTTE